MSTNAWHYTIGERLPAIFESGELRPSDHYIKKGEKPILWFSTNPHFEPTALKGGLSADGSYRGLSVKETEQEGGGLFRFGVSLDRVTSWPRIGSLAGMKTKIKKSLEVVGIRQGASPRQWYGSLDPIPIHEMRLEWLSDGGDWVDHMHHPFFAPVLEPSPAPEGAQPKQDV